MSGYLKVIGINQLAQVNANKISVYETFVHLVYVFCSVWLTKKSSYNLTQKFLNKAYCFYRPVKDNSGYIHKRFGSTDFISIWICQSPVKFKVYL